MKLTPRLKAIADAVCYRTVSDVGTDHGKIPVYLALNNKADKVIASDINKGPVGACQKNVNYYKAGNIVECRLGSGLSVLNIGEAESIIIAGMGGELISNILNAHKNIAYSAKEIILQPMNGIDKLRKYLYENSFLITDEILVREDRRIYTIIKVCKGEMILGDETDLEISPILEKKGGELFESFVLKMQDKTSKILKGMSGSQNEDTERYNYYKKLAERLNKYDFKKYS
ncbi:MAG: SAM-dependent methyltransferase [Clostridia bacterium]|nr:SAM-dependent methyltransferase [Clostridia bacterium]